MPEGRDDLTVATHEAGHVWAYWYWGLPIRYVTIRPREGSNGVTRTWGPRQIDAWQASHVAASGLIAEAMHYADERGAGWSGHLRAAIGASGAGDWSGASEILDAPQLVDSIRDQIRAQWPWVRTLAEQLAVVKTLSGRTAFEILDGDD